MLLTLLFVWIFLGFSDLGAGCVVYVVCYLVVLRLFVLP